MRVDRTSGGMSAGAGPTTHIARDGETLGSIASDFGVSQKALAKANHLPQSASLSAGQELVIPSKRQAEPKSSRGVGDVPDSMEMGAAANAFVEGSASKAFVEGAASKAFVEGSASKAFVEGAASKAFVEGSASKAFVEGAASKAFVEGAASKAFVEGAASKAFVESAALNNYVTQKGDNLRSIADRLGVSSQELAKANGLRANARLTPGQELKLPSK